MRIIRIILLILISSLPCFGATYYISPSGNDGGDGSTGSPWKTFSHSFGAMSAADTLILKDGSYSVAAGTGCINHSGTGSAQPPSGTSTSAMTIIRAENEGSVTVNGTGGYGDFGLFIGRSTTKVSYVKVQGITFIGAGGQLYNTSYVYLKNCGFMRSDNANAGILSVGTNDHANGNSYDLIEDCWAWGKARLVAVSYRSDHIVWRRMVIRRDGYNADVGPQVGITVYDSQYVSVQNVIVIDGELGGGTSYGDFATAQHTEGEYYLGPIEWVGCISLNSPDVAYFFEGDNVNDAAINISNSVAWDSVSTGINISGANLTHISATNLTAGVSGHDTHRYYDSPSGTIKNIVAYNATRYGVNSGTIVPSYVDVYGSGSSAYNGQSCTTGCLTSNPVGSAILYPVRIESGSALDGTGDGGLDYGANVIQKYGVDGTYYGDVGYNTLTENLLWPYPNEDRIKSEMSAEYSELVTEVRGFTAYSGLDGTHNTLTTYIWEYLGNEIPADIYGEEPPAATATFSGMTRSGVTRN